MRAAVLHGLIVAIPMGVGIWTVSRSIYTRFGWLLIACGIVWSFATLAESGQSLLYSLGRVAGWTIGLFAIYVVLVFPTGTLGTRLNRALMAAASAVFVVLYLPTTAMVHDYPQQTPWALCRDACPANAFQIISHEPSFVAAAVVPIREAATILILAAVIAALVHRTLSASRLRRQTLAPVLVAALIFLAAMGAFLAARRVAPQSPAVDTLGWLYGLAIPIIALGFLVGLVRWQLFVATALRRLSAEPPAHGDFPALARTLRTTLEDPTLKPSSGTRKRAAGSTPPVRRSTSTRFASQVKRSSRPAMTRASPRPPWWLTRSCSTTPACIARS